MVCYRHGTCRLPYGLLLLTYHYLEFRERVWSCVSVGTLVPVSLYRIMGSEEEERVVVVVVGW